MLHADVIKQQFLNKTVIKHSYIKTCSCTLYITEHHFIKIFLVQPRYLKQSLLLPR